MNVNSVIVRTKLFNCRLVIIPIIWVLVSFTGCQEGYQSYTTDSDIKISPAVQEDNAGCIFCHGQMAEIIEPHTQGGCVSCHQGDGKLTEKKKAHSKMISVPGNISDMKQTCGKCHSHSVYQISNSIMTTNSGLVSVDKYVFGENPFPEGHFDITQIEQSLADNHLRSLCASCHLGNQKNHPQPISEKSRGGGCTACHLNYSDRAKKNHADLKQGQLNRNGAHPALNLNVGANHCFGCHSRSGRISTNFEGWHETLFRKGDSLPDGIDFRLLEDGRYFTKKKEDVHHALGMQCIDCHTQSGVMGDGIQYQHAEDAVKISCEDCHFSGTPQTKSWAELLPSEKRIYKSRGYEHNQMLMVSKGGEAILNSYVTQSGQAIFKSKFVEKEFQLSAPSVRCGKNQAHNQITCSACHSGWAPQCVSCHVEFDKAKKGYDLLDKKKITGSWREQAGNFYSDLPSLGVFRNGDSINITVAVPGMIMSLDPMEFHGDSLHSKVFLRLYAPATPHTTTAKGRECISCHANSVALGYGRGDLVFMTEKENPHWEFTPKLEVLEDMLPADAWIPFLGAREGKISTRTNFTPFTVNEQRKILTVGACFSCHDQDSEVMLNSLQTNFSDYLQKMSSECLKPHFK